MKPFDIKRAEFVTSVGQGANYPAPLACEIALVGRSNVGKSSLINCLCNNRKLAKTSQTPGKTRLINYYRLNETLYFVDLPGYGYASVGKEEKRAWGELIESYLTGGRPRLLFILLDIRRTPSEDDRQMLKWALYHGVPYTIVCTKADKVSRAQRARDAAAAAKALGAPPYAIPFSVETRDGRDELLTRIAEIVSDPAWG